MNALELLAANMLNGFGARAVDLDEAGFDRMNREVIAPESAVAAPVPDRIPGAILR